MVYGTVADSRSVLTTQERGSQLLVRKHNLQLRDRKPQNYYSKYQPLFFEHFLKSHSDNHMGSSRATASPSRDTTGSVLATCGAKLKSSNRWDQAEQMLVGWMDALVRGCTLGHCHYTPASTSPRTREPIAFEQVGWKQRARAVEKSRDNASRP